MSLTKIGSIGINTGIAFAGVTTIVTLNTANDALSIGATVNVGSGITLGASGDIFATGVSTFSGNLKVGSGVTISPDGDGFYTGVVTATTFSGSLAASNLTGALPAISGASLTGIDTDLVSDTSPQLGGNLDANSKNIVFGDSSGTTVNRLTFGDADLSIYHDGSRSVISESGTGPLRLSTDEFQLMNVAQDETMIYAAQNLAVSLNYNNSTKFATTNTGVDITGNATISGAINTSDNQNINVGNGGDLKIFHDGTDSFIHGTTSTRQLKIRGQEIRVVNEANSEIMAKFIEDGAVELYHNNSKVFETTSVGVNITGQSTFVQNAGDANFIVGSTNASGAYLVLDGDSNGDAAGGDYAYLLHNNAGNLIIDTRNPGGDSQTQFNVNGSERLRIQSAGGISFNGDSATANALDDYEEGTFTPSIYYQNSSGITIATNSASGKYTKIGRVVWIIGYINWSVSGSPINDNVAIQGLPFSTDPGKIAAGGTRFVGNISLEGTSNESTTHQLEPYGNTGANIITDDEKGNKANELGGNSNMYAKYQFWYHTS